MVEHEGIVPGVTITFIGGPYDGYVAYPDARPTIETCFPEWLQPSGEAGRYLYLVEDELPGWMVNVPHHDTFDALYVWEPIYQTEVGAR